MDTTSTKNRMIVFLSSILLIGSLFVAVQKCADYKRTAKVYQDSTRIYKKSAAYYKVKASDACQQKVDSLKLWYLEIKQKDETKAKTLTTDAPSWLR